MIIPRRTPPPSPLFDSVFFCQAFPYLSFQFMNLAPFRCSIIANLVLSGPSTITKLTPYQLSTIANQSCFFLIYYGKLIKIKLHYSPSNHFQQKYLINGSVYIGEDSPQCVKKNKNNKGIFELSQLLKVISALPLPWCSAATELATPWPTARRRLLKYQLSSPAIISYHQLSLAIISYHFSWPSQTHYQEEAPEVSAVITSHYQLSSAINNYPQLSSQLATPCPTARRRVL